jgi:hypothetical protein
MPHFKYHVVRTDRDELDIVFGSKPPEKPAENEIERQLGERWVPRTWTILDSFDDEESAEVKLKEELAKLSEPKRDEAKGKR